MTRIVKTFVASGAIGHRRLVKFTATAGVVALATASTDIIAGVADYPSGAADGERIDIVLFGPAEVVAGGVIGAGASMTAGAAGAAVAAAPAAGVNAFTAGFPLTPAVAGDFVNAVIQRGVIQGAA
ncbi:MULTISPECIES: hypothetical protein [Agrobacterium]|uniref:hypothetical protein n=1 Tax=Agrobacterium TaxID=357 RepID=UPI000EC41316|nr:hypothetical protein [Agrobacterium sp.]MCD4663137.1 hypothetical protein [Agrobacterium sp.]HCJ70645.1 hypothetical protein [Agrobacterium sp.]